MTYKIPNQGRFQQTNKGEISGNLNVVTNIDLITNPGRIRVSPRLTVNTKDNDGGISNMGVPLGFVVHAVGATSQYYAACGVGGSTGSGKMLVSTNTDPTSAFANDALSNTPTTISADYSDMVMWNTNYGGTSPSLLVSKINLTVPEISRLLGTWTAAWFTSTLSGTFGSSLAGPINMCPAFNRNLYIGAGDRVLYVPPSSDGVNPPAAVNSGTGTLDFHYAYRVIWIRSTSRYIWIGLMTGEGDVSARGYVAMWDTTGTAPQAIFDIDAPCALSACVKDDILHITDAYGIVKKFTGSGFTEIARLPVANRNIEMPGIYNPVTNSRWIHQRGMEVVGGYISLNVNNYVSSGVYIDEMPSGVWVLDEAGLHHTNSPCADSNDAGQQLVSVAGAIFPSKRTKCNYLVGYGYYTDSGATERKGIFYDDVSVNTNKKGIVISPFASAEALSDTWQNLSVRGSPLPSGDKMIGKYRTSKSTTLPFIASITWVSTTSFTSTDANFANISGGEECEFVQGKHSSTTAHVYSISVNAGTYTVTLDEAVGSSSGSGKVKMTNFTKISAFSDQGSTLNKSPIGAPAATKIQLKTELRFSGNTELDDWIIQNKGHQLI